MICNKMMRRAFAALVFAASATTCSARAIGQSAVDGAIGGTVEDKTGGVVSSAKVVIHSNATNAEQTLTSDDSGFFRAIHLQPGVYTVMVTAQGFDTFRALDVTVTVGSLTDPQVKLTIGSEGTTIDVTGESPAINTTSPDFSNTIGEKTLEDLPVNNYRWSSYALLTPGVVSDGNGFGLLSFRGQSTLLNNVTFDGADDNQAFFSEERGRTRVGYSTAKAAIQEFQVNTSNYSVEYGRSAGGVVNAVTKSGTNALHGEAYFFDRDAEWGAENEYTTHAVETSTSPVVFKNEVFKPKDWRKQYGIGVGGPAIKDKVFFFLAFDRFNRNFPITSAPSSPSLFYSIPDEALPTGSSCAPVPSTKPVTPDPLSSQDRANCTLAISLNKTPGASITPAQYTDAQAKYVAGIEGLNSILGLASRTGDQYIFFPKVDWQVNGKNHATFEVNRLRWTSPAGIQTGTSALNYGIASAGNDYVKDTFAIAKLDTLITSTISNEVRYQYGRDFEYEYNQTPTPYETSTLLTPPGYTNPYGIPPNVNITNAFQFGTATFLNRPKYPDERRYQISDTVNYVRGNHNVKFGIDYLHTDDVSQNLTSVFGGFSYGGNNQLPLAAYFADLSVTNGCGATFNQECYGGYTQGFGPLGFGFQTKEYAGFAQDEWKVSPRLSLTLGIRYDFEQLPDPQLPNPIVDAEAANGSQIHGSTSSFPSNKGNIGPRVGFAYDVYGTGKTILRGGYGEFFARVINSTIYNAIAQTGNAKGQSTISLPNSLTGAIPGPTFPQILPIDTPTGGASSVFYFDKNFKLPEIHQADLTVEEDLGWNTTASVTWLAAYGRRLPNFVDTNLPTPTATISYTVVNGTGKGPVPNGTVIETPFYSKLPAAKSANGRPDPLYGATTDIFSGVNSNYEALVGQIAHRFTNHLSFNANYTWSHALDYGENNTTFTNSNSLLDANNLRAEYGNSNQNVPDRLVAYAVYETPSTFHGIAGYLLNQYEIAPSYSIQDGLPYSPGVTATGGATSALLIDGATGVTTGSTIGSSINGSGGTNRLPNFGRNSFRQTRTQVLDLRLSKRFKVGDKATVELLGESFNLANHVNETGLNSTAYAYAQGTLARGTVAATPNTLTLNAPFQTRTSANSSLVYSPRQVQLGVRVQF